MTFRKHSTMFIEHLCWLCIMVIICIVCLPIDQFGIMPFFALCFIIFATLMPVIHNEYVTVDNEGIRCKKKGKVMWDYAWENIIELKKGSRYRRQSVEIVVDEYANYIGLNGFSEHYFLLGRTARKAITLYYKSRL